MAKKKSAEPASSSVTPERAARLYRLVRLLSASEQSRANLLRRLGLNVRGFYRDLEAIRAAGIQIDLTNGRYALVDDPAEALARLPFPDPGLTFGEARQIAKGRSRAHAKIRAQLERIEQ